MFYILFLLIFCRSAKEKERLEQAGISEEILNSAITQFVLEIIVKHGEPADYLCNKDPFALKSTMLVTYCIRKLTNNFNNIVLLSITMKHKLSVI